MRRPALIDASEAIHAPPRTGRTPVADEAKAA